MDAPVETPNGGIDLPALLIEESARNAAETAAKKRSKASLAWSPKKQVRN